MHVRKWPHDALARPFTTTCSGGRVNPTSNASADQSPIAGLFADAAGRGAGRRADAGWRAAAQIRVRFSVDCRHAGERLEHRQLSATC